MRTLYSITGGVYDSQECGADGESRIRNRGFGVVSR